MSGNQDAFVDLGATSLHFAQAARKCDKIDSAEERIQAVQESHVAYNVPEARRNVIPKEGGCLTRACPILKTTGVRPIPSAVSRLAKSPMLPSRVVRSLALPFSGSSYSLRPYVRFMS